MIGCCWTCRGSSKCDTTKQAARGAVVSADMAGAAAASRYSTLCANCKFSLYPPQLNSLLKSDSSRKIWLKITIKCV